MGEDNRPRPIIMKFVSLEKRFEVMKLRNLSIDVDNNNYKIYVQPDLTIKQQKERKQLLEELRNRKSKGEQDIFIKNGKIVSYQSPFQW